MLHLRDLRVLAAGASIRTVDTRILRRPARQPTTGRSCGPEKCTEVLDIWWYCTVTI